MKPFQCGFKVSFLLSMIFLCVNGQLKFDADGNIIDDGLNLNIPAAPTVQKRPLVAKSKPLPLDALLNREENMFVGEYTEMEVVQRWKDTYKCTFQFTRYPFEMHSCHFIMTLESPDDRILSIVKGNIQYNGSVSVKQFKVTNRFNKTFANVNPNDTKSKGIYFTIDLKRKGGSGYKTIFLPTMILSLLAYLTLFLEADDFTNRNRISVTVLLCLTTLFGTISIREDFPKTTEFKYVDIWFLWYLTNTLLINCHHVMMDKLYNKSQTRCIHVKTSSGRMNRDEILRNFKQFWKFPKIINYVAATFFLTANVLFNIVYFSIAS